MFLQKTRHLICRGAVPRHAHLQSTQAADEQPCGKRVHARAPGSALSAAKSVHTLFAAQHHAAQHVAVAAEIFGRGMDAVIDSQFQRLLVQRRCPGIVDHRYRAAGVRLGCDLAQRQHPKNIGRWGFQIKHPGVRPQAALDLFRRKALQICYLHAILFHLCIQKADDGMVGAAQSQHMAARVQQ